MRSPSLFFRPQIQRWAREPEFVIRDRAPHVERDLAFLRLLPALPSDAVKNPRQRPLYTPPLLRRPRMERLWSTVRPEMNRD